MDERAKLRWLAECAFAQSVRATLGRDGVSVIVDWCLRPSRTFRPLLDGVFTWVGCPGILLSYPPASIWPSFPKNSFGPCFVAGGPLGALR